jgi:hypothetical protein
LETGPDGVGTGAVDYDEDDGTHVHADVVYVVETFRKGRVFHVLSILSPGDPGPPFIT